MTRHSFRWRGLAFGLFFLAVAGNWAIWKQDLLTQRQFSFTLSAVLIVLGVLGVIGTFWSPGTPKAAANTPIDTPTDTTTDLQEENHEATDSQP